MKGAILLLSLSTLGLSLADDTAPTTCMTDWIGDMYCDDMNNNMDCNYDGGDCCGPNVNTWYCSDCQCLDPNGDGGAGGGGGSTTGGPLAPTSSTNQPPASCISLWVWDGFCDDVNNNVDCSYDGGDCCGSNVNTQYCFECQCLDPNGSSEGGNPPPCSAGLYPGDPFCNDENNNAECNYDNGACCEPHGTVDGQPWTLWNFFCTDCECLDPNSPQNARIAELTPNHPRSLIPKF